MLNKTLSVTISASLLVGLTTASDALAAPGDLSPDKTFSDYNSVAELADTILPAGANLRAGSFCDIELAGGESLDCAMLMIKDGDLAFDVLLSDKVCDGNSFVDGCYGGFQSLVAVIHSNEDFAGNQQGADLAVWSWDSDTQTMKKKGDVALTLSPGSASNLMQVQVSGLDADGLLVFEDLIIVDIDDDDDNEPDEPVYTAYSWGSIYAGAVGGAGIGASIGAAAGDEVATIPGAVAGAVGGAVVGAVVGAAGAAIADWLDEEPPEDPEEPGDTAIGGDTSLPDEDDTGVFIPDDTGDTDPPETGTDFINDDCMPEFEDCPDDDDEFGDLGEDMILSGLGFTL